MFVQLNSTGRPFNDIQLQRSTFLVADCVTHIFIWTSVLFFITALSWYQGMPTCAIGLFCKRQLIARRDFAEALEVTAQAKFQFVKDPEDLYRRGYKLIRESVECGVTSMRAHVEVDTTVKMTCLEVGLRLSKEWESVCEVQVAGAHYYMTCYFSNVNLHFSVRTGSSICEQRRPPSR